jgi:hypothetical protein
MNDKSGGLGSIAVLCARSGAALQLYFEMVMISFFAGRYR